MGEHADRDPSAGWRCQGQPQLRLQAVSTRGDKLAVPPTLTSCRVAASLPLAVVRPQPTTLTGELSATGLLGLAAVGGMRLVGMSMKQPGGSEAARRGWQDWCKSADDDAGLLRLRSSASAEAAC